LIQTNLKKSHALADVVVELAGDAGAFFFLGVDEAAGEFVEEIFGKFALGDVDAGADVAAENAVGAEARDAVVDHPAVLVVVAEQAILHDEFAAGIEAGIVGLEATREVVGMNAVSPAIAEFVFHEPASEGEPSFVEEGAKLVGAGHPDERGGGVGHEPKAFFAFAEDGFLALALFDEDGEDHERQGGTPEEELQRKDAVNGIGNGERTAAMERAPNGEEGHDGGGSAGAGGAEAQSGPDQKWTRK